MITTIKLAFRNLQRSKILTLINILGLSLGLTCAIIITVWVKNELSFDKQLPDNERLYRLTFETNWASDKSHFARCWEWWAGQMPTNFPQIEELVRITPNRHTAVKTENKKLFVNQLFITDSNVFKAFGIDLLTGNPENILNQPKTVVLSASLAKKLYGNDNPVGKILMVGEDTLMRANTIKGIFKDLPATSHFHFDMLQSYNDPKANPDWAYIYIKLRKGVQPEDILKAMPAFIRKFENEEMAKGFTPFLQKVTDIHLHSQKDREIEPNGDVTSVYIFILVAFFVLLIAWVNYYNLNHVRIYRLSKQAYIQTINGSGFLRLIWQNIAESMISTILSILFCLLFAILFNKFLSPIIGFDLLPLGLKDLIPIWPFIVAILLLTILVGCLPFMLHLLHMQRTGIQMAAKQKTTVPWVLSSRGWLIIAQFVLAITLLFSVSVIFRQKQFILGHSMGNMSGDIILMNNAGWQTRSINPIFKKRALENPLIKDFTSAMEEPSGETMDGCEFETQGIKDPSLKNSIFILTVDDNFFSFFNLKMAAGNDFRTYNEKAGTQDYILNETAVKRMGWTPEEAIGKPFKLKFFMPGYFHEGTIVGVVKNFHFTNMKQEIKPYVFMQQHAFQNSYLIKIDTNHHAEALSYLNNIWVELAPDYPFEYEYLSDTYKAAYKKELVQTRLTGLFTLFAILIVCLGLFAVTLIILNQRTKEIGIRKAAGGASNWEMVKLLLKDVLIWISVACLIALPISYFLMDKWLQNFAYKTNIEWYLFVVAALVAFIIGVSTVMWQSWRAARTNPVEALRSE